MAARKAIIEHAERFYSSIAMLLSRLDTALANVDAIMVELRTLPRWTIVRKRVILVTVRPQFREKAK
jgi:hypothetical protein